MAIRMKYHLLPLVACLALQPGPGGEAVGPENPPGLVSVKVVVEGIRGRQGDLRVGLFHREGFPREERKAVYGVVAAVTGSNQVVVVAGVVPGDYAILAYHDDNGNGKVDCDVIGRPREGYGVSNNARSRWHAPDFEMAKVAVSAKRNEFVVRLGYGTARK